MQYLLDTCVLSELVARQANPKVVSLIDSLDEQSTAISAITVGELHRGIERLAPSARKRQLQKWLSVDLAERFAGRVLPIDEPVARRWGRLLAMCEARGRVLPLMDSWVAAVALEHGLTLVTRNVRDFDGTGVPLVNPWE